MFDSESYMTADMISLIPTDLWEESELCEDGVSSPVLKGRYTGRGGFFLDTVLFTACFIHTPDIYIYLRNLLSLVNRYRHEYDRFPG